MGFSLISAAEILYHCFMGLCRGGKHAITKNAEMDLWLERPSNDKPSTEKSDDSESAEDFTDDEVEQNHVSLTVKRVPKSFVDFQVSYSTFVRFKFSFDITEFCIYI